jgi:hypothetical protein
MSNIVAVIKSPFSGTNQNNPVSLKNNGASLSQNYVHNLLDVVESNPSDGATLVYNANTHKYEVKNITVSVTSLDGGSF